MNTGYDDILHLPHHVSARHPRLSMEQRAAQFASFRALSGFEEELYEAGRLTDARSELSEDQRERLDYMLLQLRGLLKHGPVPGVSVTWFCPDGRKEGGARHVLAGTLRGIDDLCRTLLIDEQSVPIEDIFEISF